MSRTEQDVEIADWTEGGDAKFSIEITTGSRTEVFEGDSEKQLIERLGVAKAKATRTILDLTAENKRLRSIIHRLQTEQALSTDQQQAVHEILQTWERIAGLRKRNS